MMTSRLAEIALMFMMQCLTVAAGCEEGVCGEDSVSMLQSVRVPADGRKPNVLFIMADDYRVEIGRWTREGSKADKWHGWATDQPALITPGLDKLSESAVNIRGMFTSYPLCSPARASLMTSRLPSTTHIYGVTEAGGGNYFRTVGGNWVTLPQYFRQNGYRTVVRGKIFHGSDDQDNIASWDDVVTMGEFGKLNSWGNKGAPAIFWPGDDPTHQAPFMGVISDSDEFRMEDNQIRVSAIAALQDLLPRSDPWFLAVGFHYPHTARYVPGRSVGPTAFDKLPKEGAAWWSERVSPCEASFKNEDYLGEDWYAGMDYRYYLAALTYVDEMIGQLLDALDQSNAVNSTLVIFTADHGYTLGHRGHVGKQVNIAEVTMVPLIFRVPWLPATHKGGFFDGPLAHVDIFPTLVDAAGLPAIPSCPKGQRSNDVSLCTEGSSFWQQLNSGSQDLWVDNRVRPVLTQLYPPKNDGFRQYAKLTQYTSPEYFTCYAEVSMWKRVGPSLYRYNHKSAAACCTIANCTTKIDFTGPQCESLFQLWEDPFELRDIAPVSPELLTDFRAEMKMTLEM